MHIAILGASGKIGFRLTKALLDRGHSVTALVHNSALPGLKSEHLKIIEGDIHNLNDVEIAISGSDVVVSTLGSWGTKTKDIVSAATKNVIPAMHAVNIKRFISVTGGGALLPHEKQTKLQGLSHTALGLIAKPILVDAETHLRLLSESSLDWTAIRSPVMRNGETASYTLGDKPPFLFAVVNRAAVIAALVDVIEKGLYVKQAPFITGKK